MPMQVTVPAATTVRPASSTMKTGSPAQRLVSQLHQRRCGLAGQYDLGHSGGQPQGLVAVVRRKKRPDRCVGDLGRQFAAGQAQRFIHDDDLLHR
jgi:hypothetical protein